MNDNVLCRAAVLAAVMASSGSAALAANVTWTGAGDGTNWSDPANWSGGVVPGAVDDVTINVAANPNIVITGVSPTIRSLTNAEVLRVAAGSTLTVSTTATSSAQVLVAGGVLGGGAWTFTGGAMLEVTGSTEGRLNVGTTINGDLVFTSTNARVRAMNGVTFGTVRFRSSSGSIAFEPGSVMSSNVLLEGTGVSGYLELYADGTLTIAPTAVMTNAPGSTGGLTVGSNWWYSATTTLDFRGTLTNGTTNSVFTVNPSVLVTSATTRINQVGGGTTNVGVRTNPQAWTNNGVISVSSGRVNLEDAFTNAGTVNVSGTGRAVLEGNWSNTGTINVSGTSRLDLGGTFTTAGMGTITRGPGGNGVVAVTGAWNNTGASFAFSPATGSYVMDGGTVTGGTVTPTANERFMFASATNAMTGVNYAGEIVCDTANGRVRIGAGTTIAALRLRGSGGGASFAPGYVINFPIVFDGTGQLGTIGIDTIEDGTLTLGPSGSISMGGDWTGTVSLGGSWWARACTFINRGTITLTGTGRTYNLGGVAFTNEGTITQTNGTSNFDMSAIDAAWTMSGTFSATDAIVNLRDRWTLATPITVNNTTVNMDGRFDGTSATRIQRTGGTINLIGTLENTGRTTTLGSTTGSWRLSGGTIVGGTVNTTPTARVIPTSSVSTVDSVTFNSEIVYENESSTRLRVIGTTVVPGIQIRGSSSAVSFGPGYVINFPIVSDGASATTHGIDSVSAGDALTVGPQGSIRSAPGSLASLSIAEGWHGQRTGNFTNQGLIECGALNRDLDILPQWLFTNTGTVRVRNGVDATVQPLNGSVTGFDVADAGSTLELNGAGYSLTGVSAVNTGTIWTLRGMWTNTGQIAINGGNLRLDGQFTLATLGTVQNTGTVTVLGTLENQTGFLLNAARGTWVMAGGTINGGTLSQTQGNVLQFASGTTNSFNNVQVAEQIVLNAGRLQMQGSARAPRYRLTSSGSALQFTAGYVMNEVIESSAQGGSTGVEPLSGNLTIGPSGVVRSLAGTLNVGSYVVSDGTRTLTNNGVIESVDATVQVNPPTLTNLDANGSLNGGTWRAMSTGTITFQNNILRNNAVIELNGNGGAATTLTSLTENAGTLTLSGSRDFTVLNATTHGPAFVNSGRINLGAGSRLTMGSTTRAVSFAQTGAGTTHVDIGGDDALTGFGNLRVHGEATLAGRISAAYVNEFARVCGQVFTFLDANTRLGNYTLFSLPPVTEETVFLYFVDGGDARFTVSARADFNEDGFLDFFDYDEYVACFEGNCPPNRDADFNEDGFVDFFDYDDFVFRFEAGC